MKNITRSFFNGLRQSSAKLCKCWRIEMPDGSIIGFTEHDRALTVDGDVYSPTNAFSSSAFSQKTDMSVDNINVTALTSDLITEADLHAGKFDNAKIKIFYVHWDRPQIGKMALMGAKFGEITFEDGKFETELRSLIQAFQQKQGRVFGLECDATFGDYRCGKDKSAYTFDGEISAVGDDNTAFFDGSRTEADDYFQYGEVHFVTGANAGLSGEIVGYKRANGVVLLLEPTAYPMEKGDTFKIVAGCDKTKPTCKGKFANYINFQGFPDMPTEQTITQTPNAK